jgi:hypothetical protein
MGNRAGYRDLDRAAEPEGAGSKGRPSAAGRNGLNAGLVLAGKL